MIEVDAENACGVVVAGGVEVAEAAGGEDVAVELLITSIKVRSSPAAAPNSSLARLSASRKLVNGDGLSRVVA